MAAALFVMAGIGMIVAASAAVIVFRLRFLAQPLSPYDTRRLRREMIESATSDEERRYLEELDALELHRRHLVC